MTATTELNNDNYSTQRAEQLLQLKNWRTEELKANSRAWILYGLEEDRQGDRLAGRYGYRPNGGITKNYPAQTAERPVRPAILRIIQARAVMLPAYPVLLILNYNNN